MKDQPKQSLTPHCIKIGSIVTNKYQEVITITEMPKQLWRYQALLINPDVLQKLGFIRAGIGYKNGAINIFKINNDWRLIYKSNFVCIVNYVHEMQEIVWILERRWLSL